MARAERARRGIGRTELLIGVAVVAVLGLIAVPLVLSMGKGSAREEVPLLVDSIREVEFAYQKPFGEYVNAEAAPRAPHEVDGQPVPWRSNAGFDKLNWAPDNIDEVFGSYRVSATATGFRVIGTSDIDGDGERAVYEATEKEPATAKTDASVY